MEKRTAARTLLSSSLARLAANSSDTAALLDAGRASIDLEHYRAAPGFLVRPAPPRPRDGNSQAAPGPAMGQMEKPSRAPRDFGDEAQPGGPDSQPLSQRRLGAPLWGQQ